MALTRRKLLGRTLAGAAALTVGSARAGAATPPPRVRRYEYVVPDGSIYVYDRDRGFAFVRRIDLPMTRRGTRGVCGSTATGMLFISYGGDGGEFGNGSLLKFDLVRSRVVWARDYPFGIDSCCVSPDGRRIYMPDGTFSKDGIWRVIETRNGAVV